MDTLELKDYGIKIGDGEKLVVMAGLNVLEDEGLAQEVCAELKAICAELDLPYIFKASWDKANRSSITSYRGPGMEEGLPILEAVKAKHGVPVVTDLHEPAQAEAVAEIAEVVQLPAFLVRQTDLVVATARAVAAKGGWLHAKKAQFLAPWDCANIISKSREAAPDVQIILCDRGTSFGYNNLVVDMLGIPEMKKLGVPVTMDATHAVQLPGADPRTAGAINRRSPRRCFRAGEVCHCGRGQWRVPRISPAPRRSPVRRTKLLTAERCERVVAHA